MLAIPPPAKDEGQREVGREISTGFIHLMLVPAESGEAWFGSGMAWSGSDSEERIRIAVNDKRKRRQGRNAGLPTLLAIGHIGTGYTDLYHFDWALYGVQVGDSTDTGEDEFRPTGEFAKQR